jgi:dipeptidyl aminopeptidase/acylaminoacyl peptidase
MVLVSSFGLGFTVHAQDTTPVVAAEQNSNVEIKGGGPSAAVNSPANKGIMSLVWNPGGTKLAYILNDEEFQAHIAVVDVSDTSAPILLDAGTLESGFPINWTPDGQILFVGAGDFSDTSKPYTVEIKRIAPEAGAVPESIGSFEMGTGCGGGSPLPGDWAYWEDTGFGGNALILQWTDYGILHSSICAGGGLALYAPQGGQDTPLADDNYLQPTPDQPQQQIGRAVLENDGKTLAAIRTTYAEPGLQRELVLIDLSTREIKPVTTAAVPDQLEWSPGGNLFYSTQTKKGALGENLTAEERANIEKVFGSSELDIPSNEVSIHMINPNTGEDTVIYTAPAYAIGRMTSTIDGQSLLFSQIANMDKWVEGMANGTLDVLNDPDGTAQRAAVPVSLYKLPLGGDELMLIGDDLSQFRLKP